MKVAEFSSPIMHYDPIARLMVLARRDPNTGQVSFQIPSEKDVELARLSHTDAVRTIPSHVQGQATFELVQRRVGQVGGLKHWSDGRAVS